MEGGKHLFQLSVSGYFSSLWGEVERYGVRNSLIPVEESVGQ